MNLISYNFSITSNLCLEGASAMISNINVSGATTPLRYYLTPVNKLDSIQNSIPEFNNLTPGKYSFTIADNTDCYSSVEVIVPKPKYCDPIISPNGDGLMDTYFNEESGTAKIIDLDGITIKQISTPGIWDGTKNDGSLAEIGYYAVVVNGKKYSNVTIVK